ncbi:alpha/beta fold hydrolase [Deinococcus radiopugnans]|uniref:Alpha/beta hydrolase n=1 Tax=Deinococcus radiopugnans ATCC 19172 TaxID=585398 RepID=A0A5C4YAQ7_9DEIO|nr:alpha/beta hydrolase [Deinococcus radiopugnans]MBB6015277.1 pimeloyl-ACP methyl ester carboxylesterase [Deinococcus radiopugnans ATCC 19172]TNM73025.1 alpha/beta hydrolase [Deinococcus radiopugnans ATCC 19172]
MTPQIPEPRFCNIGTRTLAYDEVRPEHPQGNVLLLTGLGSNRLGWRGQLPVFGEKYRTFAIDHRDTGDSDAVIGDGGDADYSTADQADDAAAFLRAMNAAPAHVVGLSMGGFIALNLAVRWPELVQSLTLVSTSAGGASHVGPDPAGLDALRPDFTLSPGERARRTYGLIMAPGFLDAHPEAADAIAANASYRPLTPERYARQFRSTRTHDVTADLEKLLVPTLVVHGDADPLVRYENGQHLAAHIPGAELVTYPGTGHIPIVERAEEFNREVLAFMARH